MNSSKQHRLELMAALVVLVLTEGRIVVCTSWGANLKDLSKFRLQHSDHHFDLDINRGQCYSYGSSVIVCHLAEMFIPLACLYWKYYSRK